MNRIESQPAETASYWLAVNGAALVLTGLFVGLAVGTARYPRLMLTVHIQFELNGMV
jgi:hypothetical protein